MKKILYLFGLVTLLSATTVFAQSGGGGQHNKSPEQHAANQLKNLTSKLNLSTDQVSQLQPIFVQHDQQVQQIRSKYANAQDKSAMRTEMKPIHEQFEASLKQILTPDQYTQFVADRKQRQQEHQGQGQSQDQYQGQ